MISGECDRSIVYYSTTKLLMQHVLQRKEVEDFEGGACVIL